MDRFEGGFVVGETVCAVTGELIQSKATRDLDTLHDQVIDLFKRAATAFKDRHSDPTQRAAMKAFLRYVTCHSEMIRLDMTERAGDPF